MPAFLTSKWFLATLVTLVVSGVLLYLISTIYAAGENACLAKQSNEQVKVLKKAKKRDEKIDRGTPFNADKPVAIEWLRKFTRPGQ